MKEKKARFGISETSYEERGYRIGPAIPYLLSVVLLIMLFASLQECSRRGALADTNLNALTDTVKHYKNRLGTITASKATLQLSNGQLQKYVLEKDKELAELSKEFVQLKSVVTAKAEILIDSIHVPYAIPVPCDFERSGDVLTKWYSFGYASNQNGFKIDSLKFPIKSHTITGIKRKWFLGKETVTTDITFDNPHVDVTEITAAELVLPVPLYKKWYVWLAVGIVGGCLISR